MFNLDTMREQKDTLRSQLAKAVTDGDGEGIGQALDSYMKFVSDAVIAEANGIVDAADNAVLAGRGLRPLTSEETKFYNEFIKRARNDAQTVITGSTAIPPMPSTIVDNVMSDMVQVYPLLAAIDFVNTAYAVKWVLNAQGVQSATWDEINTPITKDLQGAVEVIDLTQKKLSAYMFATEDMLALGPQWIDRYVRAVLADALSAGLESGLVSGNGLKEPIGMIRDLDGSVSTSTGYPEKTAKAVTALDPKTYGEILSTVAVNPKTERPRPIRELVLIVNPADYYRLIMPATVIKNNAGQYINDNLPYPTKIIQSCAVESGKAIMGDAKLYFMGVGTSKGGKLEYSDEYKFLEDLRTYKIKFYGSGRPYDNNAFVYLDISNLAPVYPSVNVANTVKTKAAT